jgi:hypothetical protein
MDQNLVSIIDLVKLSYCLNKIWSPFEFFLVIKKLVTKSCFSYYGFDKDHMTQFLVTTNYYLGNLTSFWPRMTLY